MHKIYTLALSICIPLLMMAQNQNALDFDGTNDYVETDFAGISGTGSRTVEAWIKTPYLATQQVITDWGSMTTGQRFTFNMIAGKLRCEIGGQGVTGSTTISDNNWHHVAVTFNNNSSPKFRMYVDGVLEASFNLNNVTMNTATTNSFRIGRRVDNVNHFDGVIDEVRVWNYDRSAAEIASNMGAEFCTIPNGLVAYHKFNQGTAYGTNTGVDESPDVSGNNNDGDLNGFALSGTSSNWVPGYPLTTSSVSSTVTLTGCDSLVSPSGNYLWTQSGTYYDTIQTSAGCDSNMTINLTILSNSYTQLNVTECASYTSPSGNYTWTNSGQYTDTLQNSLGCDSILSIALAINNTSANSEMSDCESVLSPSGNHVWTQSGVYFDTIPNSTGCDSILTIDVTVLQSSSKSLAPEACISYTSPSGNHIWNSSGSYNDTLTNAAGCDSILNITLTINEVNTEVIQDGYKLTAQANNVTYQWLDCEDDYSIISGSNGKTYQSSHDGRFAVRITNDGCVDTSDCFDIKIVGITTPRPLPFSMIRENSDYTLRVIPTTSDYLSIQIFDILGKQIESRGNVSGNQVFELPRAGIYLVQVSMYGEVYTRKMVL